MDLEKLRVKVHPSHTALLVIDMQKDYCCEGGTFDRIGFDVVPAQRLAPRLSQFLEKTRPSLRSVVHLKMTKIPGLLSEAMQEHYARRGIERKYDPAYGEFYGVIPREGDTVMPKYKYSGFISTYLDQFLRANQIRTLIITGVATNVCVESTARDGFMRDYHVVVPRDLTEGTSAEAKEWSLKSIDLFFGEVVDSPDLLTCWGLTTEG
jgi:ureidoacrylate peracid hydrolase